jgi:hypothetical protein
MLEIETAEYASDSTTPAAAALPRPTLRGGRRLLASWRLTL